jgi:hypothetical protein
LAALEQNAGIRNIVALGDNMIEIETAYHMAVQFKNTFIKTIKFKENPKVQDLTR